MRVPGVSGDLLALSLLVAGETVHSYSAFMPSAFTAQNWVLVGTPEEIQKRVEMWRVGYRPAMLFGLGLAAAVSFLAKSVMPMMFSITSSAVMITMYEQQLPKEFQLPMQAWPALLLQGESPKVSVTPTLKAGIPGRPAMGL